MAIEYAAKANPVELVQIDPSGVISAKDAGEIIRLYHALAYSMPRMIAYSMHHLNPITVGTSYEEVYRMWIRLSSVHQRIFFTFWCAGVDIDIFEITPGTPNTQVSVATGTTASTGATYVQQQITIDPDATLTIDSNNESDLLIGLVVKMRKKNGSGGSAGNVAAFTLAEAQDTSDINGTPDLIDYWFDDTVYADYRPLDVMKLQTMYGNIEKLLQKRIRGCAVVYPVKLAPVLSSCYLRGDGPFQWLGAPWAKTATVIFHAQCNEYTAVTDVSDYSGRVFVSAFSDAELISLDDQDDATNTLLGFDSANIVTMGSALAPFKGSVNIRSNGWNCIYVAFRGITYDTLHDFWYNRPGSAARWDDFNYGCFWVYANDLIAPDTKPDIPLYLPTVGRNLSVLNWDQINTNAPSNKGDGDDINAPSSTLRATATNNDGYDVYLFDYTNNREDRAYFTNAGSIDWGDAFGCVSPAPPFVLPNGNNGREFLTSVGRHGWLRLYSVWINDEYEPGNTARFAQANRTPSSILAKDFIQMLNMMANHPFIVYGLRHGHDRDVFNPASFGRGLNRIHFMNISDLYETPSTQSRYANGQLDAFVFPFYTGRYPDNATLGRHPKKARIKVQYAIFQLGSSQAFVGVESTNPENAKFKLGFRARLSNIPTPLTGGSDLVTSSVSYVDGVKEKVRSFEDANTQTLWDAYVNSGKAGRPNSSLANTSPYYAAVNQYDWVPEILGEKFPWDSFEFDVDMNSVIGDLYASNTNFVLASIDIEFRTYWKDGTGDNPIPAFMFGTERFVLVIASAACVATDYPLE